MFTFQGTDQLPGMREALETTENQFWIGRWELQVWHYGRISASAVDTGNTNATNRLRAGLALGMVTATQVLKQWDPTATDGSEVLFGWLGNSINLGYGSTNIDRLVGMVLIAGAVDPAKLIVPGSTALGITGNASEFLIRSQCYNRIRFSDSLLGVRNGMWVDIVPKTANYTVVNADSDKLFTNRGASGAVTFTLPANPRKGLRFGFYVVADQNVTIASGTADTLVVFNDPTADSISFSTSAEKVGAFVEVLGDGTGWLTMVHLGAETQTPTIVT